ncbi:hypothetical protein QT971_30920 [Microcoleus sp. herbarium19]
MSSSLTIARDRIFPNFTIRETRYLQKYRVSFRVIGHCCRLFGNMRWVF